MTAQGACRGILVLILTALSGTARADDDPLDLPHPDAVASRLDRTATESPATVEVFTIGLSRQGRSIRGLRFGLPGELPVGERPCLLVVAGLQGDHRIGTAVALELIPLLAARAAEDQRLGAALARLSVEVLPLLNPDGLAALGGGPARSFAVNLRKVDEDRDGLEGEDGPEDLDGDGRITQMRVRDAQGGYRPAEADPRDLVRADPQLGERGGWRLLTEGIDNDGDGRFNEDPPGGVDLARNFPHAWRRYDLRTGPSAPSEPETRALVDHLLARRRIACVLVYGPHDNLAAVPEANRAERNEVATGPHSADLPWLTWASESFRRITGVEEAPKDAADGAFHQWAYHHQGVPAFATPLLYGPAGPEDLMDWKPFDHPSLGPVEIGGKLPDRAGRPSAALLATLAEQQAAFASALLRSFPRAVWRDVRAVPRGEGVFEIRAVLESAATLPLVTAMALQTRSTMPVRVTLEAPEGSVIQGRSFRKLDRFGGAEMTHPLRWLVRLRPGEAVTLRAWTQRAGVVQVTVKP